MKTLICSLAVMLLCSAAFAHEHKPPHGGCLVEIGEEFAHVELILDATTGKLTGYVLDGEAEKAVRIKQMDMKIKIADLVKKGEEVVVELKAVANVLSGETPGDTSQFEGSSDALKGVKTFDAKIESVEIKGQKAKDVKFNFPKGNEEEKK